MVSATSVGVTDNPFQLDVAELPVGGSQIFRFYLGSGRRFRGSVQQRNFRPGDGRVRLSAGNVACHFNLLANFQLHFDIGVFNDYAALGILQDKGAESVDPGDAAANSRADVRGETSRIEAANFGDSGERGIVALRIETDAGRASEKHAKSGAVDNSLYHLT